MEIMEVKVKTCKCCGRTLPITELYFHGATSDGYDNKCKDCRKRQAAERNARKRRGAVVSAVTIDYSSLADELLLSEIRKRGYIGELRRVTTVSI